jgi:hypothetical protein
VRKWHGQGRIGFWKAFLADKGRIVIDDAHPEPDQGRSAYQRRNNMGSVAKFDFWAKSKNRVSGIQ